MSGKCNGKRNCAKEIAVGLLGFAAGFAASKLICRNNKKKEKPTHKSNDYMSSFKTPTCNDDACEINFNVNNDVPKNKVCDDTDVCDL